MKTEGCKCQNCNKIYGIDFMISDDLWKKISSRKDEEGFKGGGLLCGSCIASKLEEIFPFGAFKLYEI